MKNKLIQNITNWKVFIVIQLIASAILVGFIFKLNVLPMKYTAIIIGLLLLLCLGTFFLMKPSKEENKGVVRSTVGKVISLVLSIVLLLVTIPVSKSDSVLNTITSANKETTRISLVVLKNSSYKSLSDLKGRTIEASNDSENDYMQAAINQLRSEESSIIVQKVDYIEKLASDLYSKETPAIYVNEAYFGFFEEHFSNFLNDIRIIYSFDIEKDMKDISKSVSVDNKPFNVYITGIDTSGPVSTVSRTDVNMIATVNPKTKQILLTSIPRDCYVTLANKGKKDKLTHSGLAGVENSVKTVENFMNIDINYYARVNFTSLIEMVDALGGITVNSPVAFGPFVQGDNYMNGEQALRFVRERYSLANGDNDRIKNQQRVVTAMLQKAMSPAIIKNYTNVLDSIAGAFETNMTSQEITDLIKMQLNDMSSWDIQQVQLTGHGQTMTGGAYMPNNKLYYMIPDQSSVDYCSSLINKMMNGEKIVLVK